MTHAYHPGSDTALRQNSAQLARIAALAYCQGTPLRREIETHDASRLAKASNITVAAIEGRFGPGAVDGKIQVHVVAIQR